MYVVSTHAATIKPVSHLNMVQRIWCRDKILSQSCFCL